MLNQIPAAQQGVVLETYQNIIRSLVQEIPPDTALQIVEQALLNAGGSPQEVVEFMRTVLAYKKAP